MKQRTAWVVSLVLAGEVKPTKITEPAACSHWFCQGGNIGPNQAYHDRDLTRADDVLLGLGY